jgi:hypothetical protein
MIVWLLGRFDDGNDGANSPVSQPLQFPIGVSLTLHMELETTLGAAWKPTGTFLLTIKRRSTDMDNVLVVTGAISGDNVVDFVIVPNDTKNLIAGPYVYDVWRTNAGDRQQLIPVSLLTLLPAVGLP